MAAAAAAAAAARSDGLLLGKKRMEGAGEDGERGGVVFAAVEEVHAQLRGAERRGGWKARFRELGEIFSPTGI